MCLGLVGIEPDATAAGVRSPIYPGRLGVFFYSPQSSCRVDASGIAFSFESVGFFSVNFRDAR